MIAVSVGLSPILPEQAIRIISFCLSEQIASKPSAPVKTLSQPITLSASFDTLTYFGLNFAICSFILSIFEPAAKATISNLFPSFSITSKACVPIEPVEPIILILFIII